MPCTDSVLKFLLKLSSSPLTRLLTDGCNSYDKPGSDPTTAWFCKNDARGDGTDTNSCTVTLDLGCTEHVGGITVRNSANRQYKDRSTEDFSVLVSADGALWEHATSGTLVRQF